MQQALSGIRVLELSQGIAGPYCAKLLADFGADVLKVEPPEGDYARSMGPYPDDLPDREKSGLFLWLNLNKQAVTLDVFSPTGRQLLDRLIERSDILVCSYSPARLEELRLTYDDLSPSNPAIVVTAITPWGLTGPYRDYGASEIALDAWGHTMSAFGANDREPLTLGGNLRQYFAGQVAALASLAARLAVERSGKGQLVDVSMMEAQLANNDRRSAYLLRYQYRGDVVQRPQPASSTANYQGGYHPCKDGWIVGGFGPNNFPLFARLVGHPEWLTEARFQPIAEKWRDPAVHEELEGEFLAYLMDRTRLQVMEEGQRLGLQVFAVNTFADVALDKHLQERDYWLTLPHPAAGELTYPGAPFKMAAGGFLQRRPAPLLGEHNAEVFCGRLGLTREQLLALAAQGVTAPVRGTPAERPPAARPAPPSPSRTAAPKRTGAHRLLLAGVRVLDMTAVWAGPYATMLLGDLGAEVIRVESLQFFPMNTRGHAVRPRREDLDRMTITGGSYVDKDPGARPWNRYAPFNATGRNKLSMTVDLGRPEGLAIFKRLATLSDVVVENYSYGVMERMGLGYDALCSVNPGIIDISMPLFGSSGPYKRFRGFGNAVDAFSGFAALRGYRGQEVSMSQPVFHMDPSSGVAAALAALCALRLRERTGRGQFIDLSQTENVMHHAGEFFMDYFMNGRVPRPVGNRDRYGALQGCYRCAGDDEWVVLTVRDDQDWGNLCRALGEPQWCHDDRFATALSRLLNHDEIDGLITAWTSVRSAEDAMHLLQACGVAAAKVMNERDAFADRHLAARGFFMEMDQPDCGAHQYPGHLWKFTDTPLRADRASPSLGQDNEHVYKHLLGYSDEEYGRLISELHVGEEYLAGVGVGRAQE